MNQGKLAILVLVGLALGMAGFAVWFRQASGRRCRELWGLEHGQRIQHAPQVALRRLSPPGEPWRDISQVSGITHIRSALLEDRSFVWDEDAEQVPPTDAWEFALRFTDPQGETVLEFDLQSHRARLQSDTRWANFLPMEKFVARFLKAQLPDGLPPAGRPPPSDQAAEDTAASRQAPAGQQPAR